MKAPPWVADDTGRRITNFPQRQYDNGVAKNDATARHFKRAVRIVKKLSHEMEDAGVASARPMASFLIESLIWNAPDHLFGPPSLRDMAQGVIAHLWEYTRADATCGAWRGRERDQAPVPRLSVMDPRPGKSVSLRCLELRRKRMIDRVHVSALIAVPLASVAVSLVLAGEPLSWNWVKSFGGAVSATVGAMALFDRWAWKQRLLQGWFVKRPILAGDWEICHRVALDGSADQPTAPSR